ncbi:S-adenosyl-L-methionine-dependent methyltransferase [Xylariaceae sp. FL0662B]|nr:S-adenosyl-L-methionine-dependent methyltransferase [Xylariaceae sp. FL0662B]
MTQETKPTRSLLEHFKSVPPAEQSSRWNTCWEEEWTPWDRGGPSRALYDLLKENPELFCFPDERVRKTALVPGCGRGHDVLLLGAFGFDVYGLDLSPKATEAAKKNAEDAGVRGLYKRESDVRGSVTWLTGDFFEDAWLREAGVAGGKFDLIFDYTFFCALPASLRPAWARRMASLLAPDGRLVCLEFPSEKSPGDSGPPWASPPHAYVAYLSRPGGQVPTDEHGGVIVQDEAAPPRNGGLKRILHAKPKRTHEAGTKEGRVQDYISVWSHVR